VLAAAKGIEPFKEPQGFTPIAKRSGASGGWSYPIILILNPVSLSSMQRKPIRGILRPKVIIFDVDGLLFNTDELMFIELQRALAELGISIDESFFADHDYDDCVYALGLSKERLDAVLQKIRTRYYSDEILPHVRMRHGVSETLKLLSSSFPLAIGSGEAKEQIGRYLRHFSIEDYFSFIGHGKTVPQRKNNPEYFFTIARHFGVSPEECLHVGDSLYDQQALKAGVPVVIIPTKFSRHCAFDPRCQILESIEELPSVLLPNR